MHARPRSLSTFAQLAKLAFPFQETIPNFQPRLDTHALSLSVVFQSCRSPQKMDQSTVSTSCHVCAKNEIDRHCRTWSQSQPRIRYIPKCQTLSFEIIALITIMKNSNNETGSSKSISWGFDCLSGSCFLCCNMW